MPARTHPERPLDGTPKATIEAHLERDRATMLWKIDGLSDADLRQSLVPSVTTLLGMVKHLAYDERFWFQVVLAGDVVDVPWTDDDPDADWRIEPGESAAGIIALYESEIARSREIMAAASLDDRSRHPEADHSYAWILCHMIEEVSRHNGHADILRELIDGSTGS
jgi:uncharacterized damage-inducible protein DinB